MAQVVQGQKVALPGRNFLVGARAGAVCVCITRVRAVDSRRNFSLLFCYFLCLSISTREGETNNAIAYELFNSV